MLIFDSLSVRYGAGVQAIEDVGFEVRPGTVCAIIGGNGAGKTTLMRAVSGTLGYHGGRVVSGEIRLGETRIDRLNPHRIVQHGLALVPEGRHVFGELTVEENLQVGATTIGSGKLRQQRVRRAYEMFEALGRYRTRRASLLSGGEQQMLAIARGLMSGPEVLLLDEPSLGIAPKVVHRIGETLREINRAGTTVVLVEQNAAMALGVADQGVVIERGAISMRGDAAEMRETEEIRRMYLGGSAEEEEEAVAAAPHATIGRWEA
ncbi:ABC transporter ATP-binding protein [Leucobacter weissii]|uniref:ABC transporter ATP-binding protein n=1 Tax=Leucobacter weissii TaxID=1983706 RepID=A0A939MHN3_9MICO|nr:ABC transporter ATP-binding protein [Leucobacter weissii]MBO1900395.1 ABC transporter ATP-binding protein [Leucobacter weissii]